MSSDSSTLTPPDSSSSSPGARPLRRGPRILVATVVALAAAAGALAGIFWYYGREVPSLEAIASYRPPQGTKVFDADGRLVGEYFHERRTVVPPERIPKVLKQAVIAAEDANFYQHRGLDYLGIARALFKDLTSFRLAQGASTITQQVVKNIILSPERSLARKVKEAILARRIEQNLSKEQILWLYLNHIYFGHHRYGVEEASQYFFNKPVEKLSLAEAALLAGVPQSPARLSPLRHPQRAKARQTYVLRQMVEIGAISKVQAEAEIARPIVLATPASEAVGPYYVEEVRRRLIARYGEKQVYEGGLRVHVGMKRELQRAADAALRRGLEEVDKRFGFKKPTLRLEAAMIESLRRELFEELAAGAAPEAAAAWIWDCSGATEELLGAVDALSEACERRRVAPELTVVAPVASASDRQIEVDLGTARGTISLESLRWARPYSPTRWSAAPAKASELAAPGDLVRVRLLEPARPAAAGAPRAGAPQPPMPLELAPVPQVQGALAAVDPATRAVVAISGGYDFLASPFNRATQARRQPGSSFKPFVYAAALEKGRFTTASLVNDAPDLFRDPWTGKEWRPQNFERDVYEGPMTLREALSKSKNTVSVRLVEAIEPRTVIDFARRAGIASPMPENLTLALGTGEVAPLELANGYATFASLGLHAEPIVIARVLDSAGKVLEEHVAAPEQVVSAPIAAITTSLMQSVVEFGTGTPAGELHRPVAGKTGTTSGTRDAWFAGFTPQLVAVAWVGFDDHTPLGSSETGGRAALPVWLGLMQAALEDQPRRDFTLPPGVESVRIDPQTGLRAQDGAPGRLELFVEGSAPKEFAPRPGEANRNMLFLEDDGRR